MALSSESLLDRAEQGRRPAQWTQDCYQPCEGSSPDSGDPPHRDNAGRDGIAPRRANESAAEPRFALRTERALQTEIGPDGELLEALRRHETAHAALLADILDVIRGASLMSEDLPVPPQAGQLSPGELRVLRYLPTNLSRPEIAAELSVSVSTVSTHIRSIYAKLGADDRFRGGPMCPRAAAPRSRPQLALRSACAKAVMVATALVPGAVLTSVVRISVVSASLPGSQGADFVGEARVGGSAG
jgi:DNA-binding CsgD family transcriptional regulator